MPNDFEARARRATANLKSLVANAELSSSVPVAQPTRHPMVGFLRPAWVAVLLVIGSAVAVALVLDSSPTPTAPPTPIPATSTTTTAAVTTTVTTEPVTPTTAVVAPPAPTKTAPPTTAPDVEPPPIRITSPEDGATLSEKTITFAGITEPGARVFAGRYEADVDAGGEWRIILVLSEGANTARFLARDPAGNESEASITVHYVPPTTTTTEPTATTDKPDPEPEPTPVEFTASAVYGSCSETPPYDVYYGTGQPGTLVQITSEHGSASTEVGEEGQWEVKLIFEGAPPGVPFVVRAFDAFDHVREFEFVYTP